MIKSSLMAKVKRYAFSS